MKMTEMSSERVEHTVEKGEISRYEQFLLFPQCLKKKKERKKKKKLILQTRRNKGLFEKALMEPTRAMFFF